jgi:hypothetical protein
MKKIPSFSPEAKAERAAMMAARDARDAARKAAAAKLRREQLASERQAQLDAHAASECLSGYQA